MRIIAGTARGRALSAPAGRDTRPTSDRVREAIFSLVISHGRIADTAVLDLFAGSGAFAFEALSRGARHAVCVDDARVCRDVVVDNAARLGFSGGCTILCQCVEDALRRLARERRAFDVIFMDPPYAEPPWATLAQVGELALLAPEGLVVVEHARREPSPDHRSGLERLLIRNYGDTAVSLYSAASHPSQPSQLGGAAT